MNYYEIMLDENTTILMETIGDSQSIGPHMEVAGKGDKESNRIKTTFEKLYTPVITYAKKLNDSLKEVHGPDEVELEFAVKFSSDAGAVIAKAGAEASAKIKLKWKKQKETEG